MPNQFNITDIQFEEYRIFKVFDDDGTLHVMATAGFTISTAEGVVFRENETVELPAGAIRTRANNLKDDIKTLIKAKRSWT